MRNIENETCKVDGCEEPWHARGLCNRHYLRLLRHGDVNYEKPKTVGCAVDGCDSPHKARGYCGSHLARLDRYGDPTFVPEVQKWCAMSNCWSAPHAYGLCVMHYFRWRKWGDPFFDGRNYVECHIEGCFAKRASSKGWCQSHYQNWKARGHPLATDNNRVVPMGVALPLQPLLDEIERRGGFAEVAGWLDPVARNRHEKALDRARDRGWQIDAAVADDLCCNVLHLHPFFIWGDGWWSSEEMELVAA